MSIKNIIQQENDLQEMSQQSLANYLNNPTGQYNPYLVAGELQRKEAFAQRQMTEAPQGTVVDELVAKTMPMGGMPMGGMPQMPQPRPEEVMVSDTITETGIANLPAPNIGQNYAEGGIIGYDDGGEVGFFDQIRDFDYKGFLNERLESAGRDLDERSARNKENFRIYEETGSFPEMTEQDLDDALAIGGLGAIGKVGKQGIKTATPYVKKAVDYIKDKLKPTPKKPLTKKQEAAKVKADKAAQRKSGGKSKYKRDVEARKARKKLKPGEFTKSLELGGNLVPNQEILSRKVEEAKPKLKVVKKKVVKKKVVENNDGPRVNKVEKKVITPKNIAEDIKPTPGPLNPKYMPKKGDKEMTLEEFKKITKTKSKSKSKKILSNIFKPGITLGKTLAKLYTIGK